jgi:hypothetical protein
MRFIPIILLVVSFFSPSVGSILYLSIVGIVSIYVLFLNVIKIPNSHPDIKLGTYNNEELEIFSKYYIFYRNPTISSFLSMMFSTFVITSVIIIPWLIIKLQYFQAALILIFTPITYYLSILLRPMHFANTRPNSKIASKRDVIKSVYDKFVWNKIQEEDKEKMHENDELLTDLAKDILSSNSDNGKQPDKIQNGYVDVNEVIDGYFGKEEMKIQSEDENFNEKWKNELTNKNKELVDTVNLVKANRIDKELDISGIVPTTNRDDLSKLERLMVFNKSTIQNAYSQEFFYWIDRYIENEIIIFYNDLREILLKRHKILLISEDPNFIFEEPEIIRASESKDEDKLSFKNPSSIRLRVYNEDNKESEIYINPYFFGLIFSYHLTFVFGNKKKIGLSEENFNDILMIQADKYGVMYITLFIFTQSYFLSAIDSSRAKKDDGNWYLNAACIYFGISDRALIDRYIFSSFQNRLTQYLEHFGK